MFSSSSSAPCKEQHVQQSGQCSVTSVPNESSVCIPARGAQERSRRWPPTPSPREQGHCIIKHHTHVSFSCHSSRTTRTRLCGALASPPGYFSQEEAKQSARKLRENREGKWTVALPSRVRDALHFLSSLSLSHSSPPRLLAKLGEKKQKMERKTARKKQKRKEKLVP